MFTDEVFHSVPTCSLSTRMEAVNYHQVFCGDPCGEQKGCVVSAPALNAATVLLWRMKGFVCLWVGGGGGQSDYLR